MREPRHPLLKVVFLILNFFLFQLFFFFQWLFMVIIIFSDIGSTGFFLFCKFDNDPSAGSPTETLLRLLLPLNVKV